MNKNYCNTYINNFPKTPKNDPKRPHVFPRTFKNSAAGTSLWPSPDVLPRLPPREVRKMMNKNYDIRTSTIFPRCSWAHVNPCTWAQKFYSNHYALQLIFWPFINYEGLIISLPDAITSTKLIMRESCVCVSARLWIAECISSFGCTTSASKVSSQSPNYYVVESCS